jgi:hypothetical protein
MVFGGSSASRRTEFNMGEGEGAMTSVKVHQAPGGNSSFSLGGDHPGYEAPQPKNRFYVAPVEDSAPSRPVTNQHHQSNFTIGGSQYGDYEPPRSAVGKARVQDFKSD